MLIVNHLFPRTVVTFELREKVFKMPMILAFY